MLTLPKIGEAWTDTHSGVEGIVAWVDGTTVTFVSLTGVRANISFNRQYTTWQLKRAAPECWQACSRRGCPNHAFLQYRRLRQEQPEVVCAQHLPRGVQSQVITQQVADAATFTGRCCWTSTSCSGVETNEVLNEVLPPHTLWLCPRCGTYRVHVTRARTQIAGTDINAWFPQAVPEGYTFKDGLVLQDRMREVVDFEITVVPKASTQITGPKPLTLFDHLLMADDE